MYLFMFGLLGDRSVTTVGQSSREAADRVANDLGAQRIGLRR
jgi:hypothetical protein